MLGSQQQPEKRMRRRGHAHLTRQHGNTETRHEDVAVCRSHCRVGKTHLATALGHIAIRRRLSVQASRADKLFTRLRAAWLDNTLDAEIRKLARVDVLILDDFALRPLNATETNDFYELVERHRRASTIVTSNGNPDEWLTMMGGALLAQSAEDRLTAGAHTPGHRGPSYRQRGHQPTHVVVDVEGEATCCSLTPQGGPILLATR